MRYRALMFFAALGAWAAPPTVHWTFAVLPDDDAPYTLVLLSIADQDGEQLIPIGSSIGGPMDVNAGDGPPGTLLHAGIWWAGQGQFWAAVPKRGGIEVSTRPADEGGPGGEDGGFGEWELVTTIPARPKTPFLAGDSATITLERTLALQKTRLRGDDVRLLQRLLTSDSIGIGSPGGADGIFGPLSEGWVKEFQQERGLEADGIVGPKTWKAVLQSF